MLKTVPLAWAKRAHDGKESKSDLRRKSFQFCWKESIQGQKDGQRKYVSILSV